MRVDKLKRSKKIVYERVKIVVKRRKKCIVRISTNQHAFDAKKLFTKWIELDPSKISRSFIRDVLSVKAAVQN